jgi:hypothetical protein
MFEQANKGHKNGSSWLQQGKTFIVDRTFMQIQIARLFPYQAALADQNTTLWCSPFHSTRLICFSQFLCSSFPSLVIVLEIERRKVKKVFTVCCAVIIFIYFC